MVSNDAYTDMDTRTMAAAASNMTASNMPWVDIGRMGTNMDIRKSMDTVKSEAAARADSVLDLSPISASAPYQATSGKRNYNLKDDTSDNPNIGAPLRHGNGLFPAQSRAARPPGQPCLDRYSVYPQRKGTDEGKSPRQPLIQVK